MGRENTMNGALDGPTTGPLTPDYKVYVFHPDSREPLDFPLRVLIERIERALKVQVLPQWYPTLVAMADGLFLQEEAILVRISRVATLCDLDPREEVERMPAVMERLVENKICEVRSVADLYHLERLDELSHPRVWELNGWWHKLYGVVKTRTDWDAGEDLELWEDAPPQLKVGRMSLPVGVSPERDEVRTLLEKKLLSQYEPLYRLRLSWYR